MKKKRRLTTILGCEVGGFVAQFPELGVAGQGDTIEEGRANLQEALELFLETAPPDEINQRDCLHPRQVQR
jgi:predicted RNase H-like HicB family nuclease